MRWMHANMDEKLKAHQKMDNKTVYIIFIVHRDESRTDFEVARGAGEPYDTEALRLVRDNPLEWVAAECESKKLTTRTIIPIRF